MHLYLINIFFESCLLVYLRSYFLNRDFENFCLLLSLLTNLAPFAGVLSVKYEIGYEYIRLIDIKALIFFSM